MAAGAGAEEEGAGTITTEGVEESVEGLIMIEILQKMMMVWEMKAVGQEGNRENCNLSSCLLNPRQTSYA